MTFTYEGDPAVSDIAKIRFLVGDTDSTDQLLSDEEIAYLLDRDSRILGASALACEAIGVKLIRSSVSYRIGPLTENNSQLRVRYGEAANRFRTLAMTSNSIIAGAIEILDKQATEEDTSLVPPRFVRDQFAHLRNKRPLVNELASLL